MGMFCRDFFAVAAVAVVALLFVGGGAYQNITAGFKVDILCCFDLAGFD